VVGRPRPAAGRSTDYAFVLDSNEPLPDPRSSWQPSGVHGPARVVDHTAFSWTDARWQPGPLSSAVIYELHVGTFTPAGTFEAVIERLGHLVGLGVTHVELMPVAEFPGSRGWGCDGVDLYAPHHAYGGPEGLKRLVNACHAHGLACCSTWSAITSDPAGTISHFGPYFTDPLRHAVGLGRELRLGATATVRRLVSDNALMWLSTTTSTDYASTLCTRSSTRRHYILEQLATPRPPRSKAHLGRHLVLIAESDNDPRVVRSPAVGGYVSTPSGTRTSTTPSRRPHRRARQYYADFGSARRSGHDPPRGFVYAGCYSRYRRRRHGRPATSLSGHRFVGCLQNHDQVGNRAWGERSNRLMSPGRLKIGAALVFTAPFVPMLFQGRSGRHHAVSVPRTTTIPRLGVR
jgi:maltooligosyltrehalose trehalohydrolase